ncbi:MAG: hypothetical protein HY761_04680 [Candidatus Omnitrophica bacterium]|nr:hypothetical protein [Candidatus Omnitrophota bacterium]
MSRNKNKVEVFFRDALPAVLLFTAIYLFIFFIQGTPFVDDPYIAYRYAENWAAGHGPVFNIGEYVEGYSSFLSVAIYAAASFLSFNLVTFSPVLNLFIGIGCILLMSYICTLIRFSRPRVMTIVILMLYTLSYGVYHYGASGWTDMLLSSLALLYCIISLYKSRASGNYLTVLPSLLLLNIVRAEGPLYALFMLSVLTWFVFLEYKYIPKKLIMTISVFIALTVMIFLARHSFYKEWVPATVMAKGYASYSLKKIINGDLQAVKGLIWIISEGIKYEAPLLYTGVLIPFILLFRNRDKNDFLLWLIASGIAVNAFVLLLGGGDFFRFHRQLIPVLPLMLILVGWGIDSFIYRVRDKEVKVKALVYTATVLILVLSTGFFLKPVEILKKRGVKPLSFHTRQIGTFLNELHVPAVLLTDVAGMLPYYAGPSVYVRDLFGLTDIHNAKYGEDFCAPSEGGVCGRTDYKYSFSAPFDVFVFNACNINEKFISFCKENPAICNKYQFFMREEWHRAGIFIVADKNHPVTKALVTKYNAKPLPVNEDLLVITDKYK